jgi:predicted DNA-binding transcriptional regulator AlpA
MTSILNMTMTQEYTSLSRATINRCREIGDFPQAVQLTGSRIGFYVSELDEWLAGRPRKKGPEVNDNKKLVRCPQTPLELEEAQRQEYAELKARKGKQASGR